MDQDIGLRAPAYNATLPPSRRDSAPSYVTYDGGSTWLYQSSGGGVCCHVNDIWAFDTTHAIWHEGGAGDPNGESQLFTYVEPWEANFEILPEVTIKNGYVKGGDANVPMASYKLFNHGPVPNPSYAIDGPRLRGRE